MVQVGIVQVGMVQVDTVQVGMVQVVTAEGTRPAAATLVEGEPTVIEDFVVAAATSTAIGAIAAITAAGTISATRRTTWRLLRSAVRRLLRSVGQLDSESWLLRQSISTALLSS
jgi:hypothetical protein